MLDLVGRHAALTALAAGLLDDGRGAVESVGGTLDRGLAAVQLDVDEVEVFGHAQDARIRELGHFAIQEAGRRVDGERTLGALVVPDGDLAVHPVQQKRELIHELHARRVVARRVLFEPQEQRGLLALTRNQVHVDERVAGGHDVGDDLLERDGFVGRAFPAFEDRGAHVATQRASGINATLAAVEPIRVHVGSQRLLLFHDDLLFGEAAGPGAEAGFDQRIEVDAAGDVEDDRGRVTGRHCQTPCWGKNARFYTSGMGRPNGATT